ncbi:MAG TPA: efflux RND transporter periplasmic adaptor subunit, partial [Gemmatales bacterium]|nr:efflux RND transporter periplasmic adaptor subunit [Gemmatales bacterium]
KSLVAQVSAAENDLTRAKLDKEYSEIKAEVSGRISRAQLTVGNLVNAGGSDPLLTTIVAIDTLRLYFNVDERSLQAYARNLGLQGRNLTDLLAQLRDQKTIVKFAQDGEKLFAHEGDLAFGDNRIDPSTGTLQVYATVANKDRQFLPGARVRVRLVIGKAYDALLVPESAILADQDKRYVLVIDAEKVVRRRNVTLGALTDDSMRAVTPADKLDPQENPSQWLVIVDNLQRARLNYPVNPQTATATASEAGAAPPTTTTAPAATAPTSAR